MTKKTVAAKKAPRGAKVDLETFLSTPTTKENWAEEMEDEPVTVNAPSTGVTLEELRANNDNNSFNHGSRSSGGFGYNSNRQESYSRELSASQQSSKVKPSSFFSEGAPQKASSFRERDDSFGSFGGERRDRGERGDRGDRGERVERKQYDLPTEKPFICFIGNLNFAVTKDELEEFFESSNPINISLPKDKETQRPRGHGYLEFDNVQDMKTALLQNGASVAGRPIKIDIASPETSAHVTIANRDVSFGRRRDDRGFSSRRDDGESSYEDRLPPSIADKSDNWRAGGSADFGEVNPFGNKKKQMGHSEENTNSSPFGSSFNRRSNEERKPHQDKPRASLFGEGKAWEPKEKDLKSYEPNLENLASKKVSREPKERTTGTTSTFGTHKKEGESQDSGFQTATGKQRGGRRQYQATTSSRGSFTKKRGERESSPQGSEEVGQQSVSNESNNQYAALSEQRE